MTTPTDRIARLETAIALAAACMLKPDNGITDTVWLDNGVTLYEHLVSENASIPGVRVGSHIAPPSGREIEALLEDILYRAPVTSPYLTHHDYETLHPFTDGNGRSGRDELDRAYAAVRDLADAMDFIRGKTMPYNCNQYDTLEKHAEIIKLAKERK